MLKTTHFKRPYVGGSITERIVNPDLQEERRNLFDKEEMVRLFIDEQLLQEQDYYADDILKYPQLQWDQTFFDMNREESMRAWWKKLHEMYKIDAKKYFYDKKIGTFSYEYMHAGVSPLTVHWQMFRLAVEKLASDEQNAKWNPLMKQLKMIGSYVQTEMGHGSNVAGLETTATFDKEKDQIVIHSPTITSTKMWPGSIGIVANHAIVFARLIVDGDDFGV
jgi:alkylation response protein AidB-like acyl-CoA dehydrogenase